MPDDNKTTDTKPAPTQDIPGVGQTIPPMEPSISTFSPPPVSPTDQGQATDTPPPATNSAVPPPPPIIEEQKEGEADIPPVVTTGEKPKGKVGKKVIATILGILFLVGGVSAGVILVQQQQEIREMASIPEPCLVCQNNVCTQQASPPNCLADLNECAAVGVSCGTTPTPAQKCDKEGECASDYYRWYTWRGECAQKYDSSCKDEPPGPTPTSIPTPTPTGGGSGPGQCGKVTQTGNNPRSVTLTLTQAMITECQNICTGTDSTPWIDIYEYQCDEVGLTGGCQDNGRKTKSHAGAGTYSTTEPDCGTVQIDAGCFNIYGAYGSVAYASKADPRPCTPATPTPGGGISARCLNVRAFDTGWNELISADLSSLKAGDTIRFTASGTTSSGNIDKARFRINSPTWRTVVTTKRPGTSEFYDEYTIPEGVTSFTINAQLHHTNTGIDWF